MMTWPGCSHVEPGTALGPGCLFGEVPDGMQERAPEPLQEASHTFLCFTHHPQRRSPRRWAPLNLTPHPKSEDAGRGKDHVFAVVRKGIGLNNLRAQTTAKGMQ